MFLIIVPTLQLANIDIHHKLINHNLGDRPSSRTFFLHALLCRGFNFQARHFPMANKVLNYTI